VAIAFLGVVVLYATAAAAGIPTLSWQALTANADGLGEAGTRFALVLATLGFATKAGLAPMHAWLPDAHSQAPAPVSALMSGVLLSVALYVILRLRTLADLALGPQALRPLLLGLGLASLAVGAVLLVTQRDYKRLLAYSSIEHMGLMAVAAAIGGTLATGALLAHMIGHGIVKAAMFLHAGRILSATSSSRIAEVTALLKRSPSLARPWLTGMAALAGFPPFPLFFTEVAIVVAGWQAGLGPAMTAVVALLLIAFAGLTRHSLTMTLESAANAQDRAPGAPSPAASPRPDGSAAPAATPRRAGGRVTIALAVAACLVLLTPAAAPVLAAATSALQSPP
jgi:hydrogenase-4 component F